ncbi:MAG TPA: serine/threonine-protein kinase, partial [Polyangiaceae bacterium]|nr:serine/threonine-protein kinase [Polyangiaceae bacterium]
LVSAIGYPALYFVLLRQRIDPAMAALPIYQPTMQLTRGASLLVGGTLCAVVTHAVRLVFARAQRKMRAQDLFGKYRIGERVASGGMATVFRALYCPEGGFERAVAVKRIHPHLAVQSKFVASFRVEAELCARLVHPNIVQVLDFGRIDESYFLAMEYVHGLTLRALMQRARRASMELPPTLCAFIARELLAGLGYSHAGARDAAGMLLRVVHRDLSPANVLLSRHGEVKITDFGVAKALRDAAVSETRTIAGHLAYMAPEQAAAQPIDERCDLFAVGVIVWELLCGKPLFLRDGEGPTLLALMNYDVPPPSHERAGLDPEWDRFVARALARAVENRYTSADEMAADLNRMPDARVAGASEALARLVADLDDLPVPEEDAATDEVPTRVVG